MAFSQRELQCFLAVVDTGSLGRAAMTINLSQPALSRLIQGMEQRLQQPLFERTGIGMSLSPAGDALVPHARLLLFEMAQAVDALDALRGVKRGLLRIGAVAAVVRSILPETVATLLRHSPLLQVSVLEGADNRLVQALENREVDLLIAGGVADDVDIAPIGECRFDDSYMVFCARDHPLAAARDVSLADVLREEWTMPPRGATPRELFERALHAAGAESPRVAVETWSPGAIAAFVTRTRYLGWLPRPLIALEEKVGAVRVLAVPELTIGRRFFIYRRKRGLLPPAAGEFLRHLPRRTIAPTEPSRRDSP